MEKQVLSREQMQELIDMGIDNSKASMCWIIYEDGDYEVGTEDLAATLSLDYTIEKTTPTFTLQDILEMLPNTIEWKGKTYWFSVFINGLGNKMIGYRDSELWALEFKYFNINGAFDILKWCKENEYI